MGKMHARMPKNFVLEKRLERYASAIEPAPERYAGRWAEACAPLPFSAEKGAAATGACGLGRFSSVRLDLGCGKGAFLVESARREPDALFIGMDAEPVCVAYAAQAVCEAAVANAVVVPGNARKLDRYFAPGELERIYVNFPTPHPKAHDARERLTYLDRLLAYRALLAPGGTLNLKTDSQPFYAFTLTQLELAGYKVLEKSRNLRTSRPDDPMTGYEERLCAQGARVHGICATPGPLPARIEQTAALSLMDYLPQDLDSLDYVPLGMERAVENFRNRRTKLAARALSSAS